MMKILLVDDHTIVRHGLVRILSEMDCKFEIDQASNGQEALAMFNSVDYALVLLDISMPGRNGLEILKCIKRDKPTVPVLMLSMHSEGQYAVRSLRLGAAGYITKESASHELQGAVSKVLSGGKYLGPSMAELLAETLFESKKSVEHLHESLSDREQQLVGMMATGKTMTEIANELCLSIKTISTYRTRILEKLNLRTSGEIIAYAIKNDLSY
ncbi:MAG: DNA-binding response regulator [Geobacteraceae bacterium GWC2_55_20]|nr:MAG: DNA-binding response regulator [Geobacteraceae bacterium GWC2_55_20]OGU25504.1 MAG: DNA-binding response regulator [Geobacteraceae bacterium GWF2_54_21]HBA72127.1 DNA-binding response regulator [Geobacter sp.]HCE68081.1 DNA-binding response regulator [Geobacter sp.]